MEEINNQILDILKVGKRRTYLYVHTNHVVYVVSHGKARYRTERISPAHGWEEVSSECSE